MKRALIVDDDKTILMVVEKVLKGLGLQVEMAADAQQALRFMKMVPFDLIITDANMPGLSGYELLEIVKRNHKNFGEPKVIMLTQRTAQRDQDLALMTGAHKFLSKPVASEVLRLTVVDLLGLVEFRMVRESVTVYEPVRMINSFEIVRIFEDGIEITAPFMLRTGLVVGFDSPTLASIGPAFTRVEVTSCLMGKKEGEFVIMGKFVELSTDDVALMTSWFEDRKAA